MLSVLFPTADWMRLAAYECMEHARKAYAANVEQEFQRAMQDWTKITALEFERRKNGH